MVQVGSGNLQAVAGNLGDITPGLQHLPIARAPSEPLWLTVHRDLRQSPRVRVLLDFLVAAAHADRKLLTGR